MNKKERKRMFFWEKFLFLIHINSFKASLQSCHKRQNPNKSDIRNNPKRIKTRISERTFSSFPSYYQASMCLEASLSFSFFLLFLMNIFSILFLYMVYTQNSFTVQQKGKEAAAYFYLTEDILQTKEQNLKFENLQVVKAPFSFLAFPKTRLYARCVIKPWTGYDVTQKKEGMQEEQIVYLTEYGTVYHKNRSCSYLSLSIQAVPYSSIAEKRNEDGEKYLFCDYCRNKHFVTVVYITSYGNKYHTTTKCRSLKRSVVAVPLSEANGKEFCKKCGS